jgi:hypothetical protein
MDAPEKTGSEQPLIMGVGSTVLDSAFAATVGPAMRTSYTRFSVEGTDPAAVRSITDPARMPSKVPHHKYKYKERNKVFKTAGQSWLLQAKGIMNERGISRNSHIVSWPKITRRELGELIDSAGPPEVSVEHILGRAVISGCANIRITIKGVPDEIEWTADCRLRDHRVQGCETNFHERVTLSPLKAKLLSDRLDTSRGTNLAC